MECGVLVTRGHCAAEVAWAHKNGKGAGGMTKWKGCPVVLLACGEMPALAAAGQISDSHLEAGASAFLLEPGVRVNF